MFIDAGEGMFSITTRDNGNGTLNGRTCDLLVFKVSVKENLGTLLDFVVFGFLA